MTTKEILLEQFTACNDENGWFVALKNAVKDLMAEQALWTLRIKIGTINTKIDLCLRAEKTNI